MSADFIEHESNVCTRCRPKRSLELAGRRLNILWCTQPTNILFWRMPAFTDWRRAHAFYASDLMDKWLLIHGNHQQTTSWWIVASVCACTCQVLWSTGPLGAERYSAPQKVHPAWGATRTKYFPCSLIGYQCTHNFGHGCLELLCMCATFLVPSFGSTGKNQRHLQ